MDRDVSALVVRKAIHGMGWAPVLSVRATTCIIALLSIVLVSTIAIAPPLLAFALAVAVGIAWCIWLDGHPDETPAESHRPTGSSLVDTENRS